MVNLITDPAFALRPDRLVSLPALLAAMTREETEEIQSLCAPQRAAWHTLLVHPATPALWRAGHNDLPR